MCCRVALKTNDTNLSFYCVRYGAKGNRLKRIANARGVQTSVSVTTYEF